MLTDCLKSFLNEMFPNKVRGKVTKNVGCFQENLLKTPKIHLTKSVLEILETCQDNQNFTSSEMEIKCYLKKLHV